MATSGANFAAKSLCLLAQEAKTLGYQNLQLEWVRRAHEINPEDAWASGQAADAYIVFNRFDEALALLSQAEAYGEHHFAANGRARILRARGKLDEALKAFISAENKYRDLPEVEHSWIGHAEVLRDMWLFDRALSVYEEAATLFPNSRVIQCGRAAVFEQRHGYLSRNVMGRYCSRLEGVFPGEFSFLGLGIAEVSSRPASSRSISSSPTW